VDKRSASTDSGMVDALRLSTLLTVASRVGCAMRTIQRIGAHGAPY